MNSVYRNTSRSRIEEVEEKQNRSNCFVNQIYFLIQLKLSLYYISFHLSSNLKSWYWIKIADVIISLLLQNATLHYTLLTSFSPTLFLFFSQAMSMTLACKPSEKSETEQMRWVECSVAFCKSSDMITPAILIQYHDLRLDDKWNEI